jgi:hypothetical protein
MRDTKYTEIFKLRELLKEAGIPYEMNDRNSWFAGSVLVEDWGWQVLYPSKKDEIISVIEGYGTYGEGQDLLEIMGLLTEDEEKDDQVVGHLSADDVFGRIYQHWLSQQVDKKTLPEVKHAKKSVF